MDIKKVLFDNVLALPRKVGAHTREGSQVLGGRERRTSFSQGMRARAVLFTSVLLGSGFVCLGNSEVVDLDPGQSVKLSQLASTNGSSVLVGDKLFANFSFQSSDTAMPLCDTLPSSAFTLTALSNNIGFGVSLSGPMTATGSDSEDVVLRYSITVTNSSQLISDIHLDYNGTVIGSGLSSVVESVFTGGFGGTPLAQINVFNVGVTNQLGTAANLPTPEQQIYVENDITFSGGAPGNQNAALISIIDETFSQVPEPSTIMLSVSGLLTLLFIRRRK